MSFSFGLSKKDITPGFRTCLACSQLKDTLFERIHDPLFVRCIVLNNDGHYLIIVSYDLLFHSRELYGFVHKYVQRFSPITMSDILINYTHDHNAPSVIGYNDHSASKEYEKLLESKTKAVLDDAFSHMVSGTMEYGVIPGDWNINRRRPTTDGIKLAPNPNGPADKNLYVLKFLDINAELKGLLVNYACHPVHYPDTLGLTSEYPGFLCKYLEDEYPGCTPVFIQGAGADTRPLGTAEKSKFVHRSYEYIERMAQSMKSAIVESMDSDAFSHVEPSFSSICFSINIPTDDEGIEHFRIAITDQGISAHLRRNAQYVYDNHHSMADSFTLECGLIKLSDKLVLAHMGGEPVCEVKFNIETALSDIDIIFAGYTDACSYIVTDNMIDEGGYEVRCFLEYMHKGRIKKGIDELLKSAFKDAVKKL